MNPVKVTRTRGRRARQKAIRLRSIACTPSGITLVDASSGSGQSLKHDHFRKPASTSWDQALAGSLRPPLVVDEDRAAGHDDLAGLQPLADLQAAVLLHSDRHSPTPEYRRLLLDPDGGDVAIADQGFHRNRRGADALSGRDPEGGEHLRLERAVARGPHRSLAAWHARRRRATARSAGDPVG